MAAGCALMLREHFLKRDEQETIGSLQRTMFADAFELVSPVARQPFSTMSLGSRIDHPVGRIMDEK